MCRLNKNERRFPAAALPYPSCRLFMGSENFEKSVPNRVKKTNRSESKINRSETNNNGSRIRIIVPNHF